MSDPGLNEVESADFVQALLSFGEDEWHYPLETLFLRNADSPIPYSSLMESLVRYGSASVIGSYGAGLSIGCVKDMRYTSTV